LVRDEDTKNCGGFFEPMVNVKIDGKPINTRDPALQKFMKALGMSLDDNFKNLFNIETKLNTWLSKRFLGPGTHESPLLDDLFALRSTESGWSELDRVLNHLAGVTFSQVVDNAQPLHDADDPGLHGALCYSVVVNTSNSDRLRRRKACKAVASTPERIVELVFAAIQAIQNDFIKAGALGGMSSILPKTAERNLGEPFFIEVKKNGRTQWGASVVDAKESGYVVIDWASLDVHVEDMDMLKALLTLVPEEAKLLVKGRFLQGQLGL
jgi:hypothetical protein